jgi:hypothetical protein
MDGRNKLECLSLAGFFQPSLMFVGMVCGVEIMNLKGASIG